MNNWIYMAGLAALLIAGCSEPSQENNGVPGSDSAAIANPHAGGMGNPHAAEGNPHAAATAANLNYQAPEGWVKQQTSNPMRKDQYLLPGENGAGDGELTVFHFPEMGGQVRENLDRWLNQFEQADGTPMTAANARIRDTTVNGLKVTTIFATGTFLKPTSPMMQAGEVEKMKDHALLGAIVETSAGPWFFKATGPQKTIERWLPGFAQLVGSFRAA